MDGRQEMYLKPDSALLVNDKPFFLPLFSSEIVARPCIVFRINRLGRNVARKFAHRYFDSYALGLNMQQVAASNYTERTAFDNSLAVGQWAEDIEQLALGEWVIRVGEQKYELRYNDLIETVEEAIEYVTRYITIRMGDMIAVDFKMESLQLSPEQVIEAYKQDNRLLYCKIK